MLNLNKIIKIVAKSIKVREKNISLTSKIGDFEDWDSLGHLGILLNLDKALKGKAIKIKDLAEAHSVKKILTILFMFLFSFINDNNYYSAHNISK